ncbi:MAG: alpha-amylase family glycosyl hydrolase [Sideroxydans sp.]|nr:alpha-amylase family glycosyl hydrolase [Sideroxydans sp.]
MYFVLIDRYADGDRSNNQKVEQANPGGWHGGDLKGLTRQLDELSDLGVTALWINPVQKQINECPYANAPAKLGIPEFRHCGFHGYWIDDFSSMDAHLGNLDDLKSLVDEAHKRNIKVLLDVVYNHAGYNSSYRDRLTADGQRWLRVGEGNCDVDPVKCAVGGLPDFKTELPEVRKYLLDANIELAKRAGVDGFRLDTYKHIETDFWAEHRQRTRAEIDPNFFLLAEYWGGNAGALDQFFARDEVDAGFDFGFKGSCESFVSGRGRAVAYGSYLGSRHKVRNGYLLAHYLSSHDEPMSLSNLGGDKDKFRICAAVQMTSIGLPVIYYGEEVARGGSEWPLNRNNMPWGARDIRPGKGVARDESLRSYYKSLLHIRKSHPALSRGEYAMLSRPSDKVLVYVREEVTSKDRVLVAINREAGEITVDVTLPVDWNEAAATDELSSEQLSIAAGHIKLIMAPKSVRILSFGSGKVVH